MIRGVPLGSYCSDNGDQQLAFGVVNANQITTPTMQALYCVASPTCVTASWTFRQDPNSGAQWAFPCSGVVPSGWIAPQFNDAVPTTDRFGTCSPGQFPCPYGTMSLTYFTAYTYCVTLNNGQNFNAELHPHSFSTECVAVSSCGGRSGSSWGLPPGFVQNCGLPGATYPSCLESNAHDATVASSAVFYESSCVPRVEDGYTGSNQKQRAPFNNISCVSMGLFVEQEPEEFVPPPPGKEKLEIGPIVGGVFGAVAGVALLGFAFFLYKHPEVRQDLSTKLKSLKPARMSEMK